MQKKKPVVKKPKPPAKPEQPMSKGFGHLTIPKDVKVRDSSASTGGEKRPDSRECWEDYQWD